MRSRAKAPLFAGVAAIAVMLGMPAQQANIPSSLADRMPIQLGSPAQAQTDISVGIFFDRLSSHGRWVSHNSHGYVFVPTGLDGDWRPYTRGHWVHTEQYGWYWDSDEPFGWATYHYGRWGYSPSYGWYWVPGNVWAPAWVTWRTGGEHIGWAPIAPEGDGYAWGAPASYRPPVAESWVFIETRYITAPAIIEYVAPIPDIPVLLTEATTRVDIDIDIEQNIIINQPIEITEIENVVVEPVQTVELTFADDPDAVTSEGTEVVAFQAEIPEEEPQEPPADAVESADQIGEPALIEETLEEVPEEADAPSAAEVAEEPTDAGAAEEPAEAEDGTAAESEEVPQEEAEEPAADEGAGEETTETPAGEEAAPAEEGAPAGEEAADPAAGEEEPTAEAEEPTDDAGAEEAPAEGEEAPAEGEEAPAEEEPAAEDAAPAEEEAAPAEEEAAPAEEQPAPAEEEAAPAEEEAAPEGEPAPPAEAETLPAPAEEPAEAPAEAQPDQPAEGEPAQQPCPEGQETC